MAVNTEQHFTFGQHYHLTHYIALPQLNRTSILIGGGSVINSGLPV